ncbi:aldo/keto reductase [Streptomyces rishiriensis]|uniref:aldo/keto reductase n=1 Tax=Streptomyces rishiriensis TaxID=68264 RepID=UPI001C3FB621|nr:aldo/keto reductase [Streptomyces rishiriensis]
MREQLPWGTGSDLGESARVLDRFADAGGTFIDTAESYQAAESEEILGLLRTRRDRFTLATKFAIGPAAGGRWMSSDPPRRRSTRSASPMWWPTSSLRASRESLPFFADAARPRQADSRRRQPGQPGEHLGHGSVALADLLRLG